MKILCDEAIMINSGIAPSYWGAEKLETLLAINQSAMHDETRRDVCNFELISTIYCTYFI